MAWLFGSAGAAVTGRAIDGVNVDYPTSISSGDALFIFYGLRNGADEISVPADWVELSDVSTHQGGILGKVATGAESGSLALAATPNSVDRLNAVMVRFTGSNHSDNTALLAAKDADVDIVQVSGSADITIPAATINFDGELILTTALASDDEGPYTPPTNFTELIDVNDTTVNDCSFVVGYWIQTTKANLPGTTLWDSSLDVGTPTTRGVVLSLKLGAAGSRNLFAGKFGGKFIGKT